MKKCFCPFNNKPCIQWKLLLMANNYIYPPTRNYEDAKNNDKFVQYNSSRTLMFGFGSQNNNFFTFLLVLCRPEKYLNVGKNLKIHTSPTKGDSVRSKKYVKSNKKIFVVKQKSPTQAHLQGWVKRNWFWKTAENNAAPTLTLCSVITVHYDGPEGLYFILPGNRTGNVVIMLFFSINFNCYSLQPVNIYLCLKMLINTITKLISDNLI